MAYVQASENVRVEHREPTPAFTRRQRDPQAVEYPLPPIHAAEHSDADVVTSLCGKTGLIKTVSAWPPRRRDACPRCLERAAGA